MVSRRQSEVTQRDLEEGRVLRGTEEGAGENVSAAEVHQQDGQKQAGSWAQPQRVAGNKIIYKVLDQNSCLKVQDVRNIMKYTFQIPMLISEK